MPLSPLRTGQPPSEPLVVGFELDGTPLYRWRVIESFGRLDLDETLIAAEPYIGLIIKQAYAGELDPGATMHPEHYSLPGNHALVVARELADGQWGSVWPDFNVRAALDRG